MTQMQRENGMLFPQSKAYISPIHNTATNFNRHLRHLQHQRPYLRYILHL
jgi:hypothetical protein